MKICIPVNENKAIESTVCGHFGSAPFFMIVDTESLSCKSITNENQHHSHGMCQPLAAISNEKFEAIVVGGIGTGALKKISAANIKVYKTTFTTAKETVVALNSNLLKEVDPQGACSGHHHD